MFSFLFFLSFSSLALVASVGFERRTWALRVPLPLHLVHLFEFSTVIRGSYKLRSLLFSWVLGTLELVPLGCLGALDGWCCSVLNHCGVKLRASVGVSNLVVEVAPSNLMGTGDRPQGLPKCTGSATAPKGCHLYGFGDRPQGSLSGITAPCIL